jgi:predicted ATPase
MQKPLRVALVGSGGVGKSTLLRYFEDDGFTVFPSITREFYELMGIPDQAAYMQLGNNEKANFQRKMRNYYQAKYLQFVQEHPHQDTVTDRSIFDHMAYGIYGLHDQFTIKQIHQLIDTCVAYSNSGVYTNLIYFPYPLPWQEEHLVEDGFRNVEPAQDYSVAAIMLYTIFYEKVVMNNLHASFSPLKRADMTPQETYHFIQQVLNLTREEMANG